MKDLKTVLYATDFSESSDFAFEFALTLAKKFDARLLLVHVVNEPVDLRGFYVPHISFDKLEEEIQEGAKKMMEKFCRKHLSDYSNYETFVLPGIPYDEIIKKGEEEQADLIVMGTHGRTGLDHVLFGSTAEKVVRKSPIPVMTIRVTDSE
ncbi:Nucleotide-binding universal stress protein, UspA family [Geoalkalibacter ferrihydriticus]|uniref:Universal stress protein n=2 Tax=Geoalkalibacter ferrihydriticus TaxID=392333 RepID=A0A0C2DU29_9BACT|nr:universal stress protein [Geoalkalibacter ferrihydriticus]KIH76959.1 universal stress protein [Geoalkalibacter ferrihydriticus DSM 17813]SDL42454.1 Nucleotide-binding universal stress protein, UspA family [Geoalkalibacter ferrihydriticus]